jgi:hypothetical protein
MLLITADTGFCVTNATEHFKDNFVFYSPTITFGVDFSVDVPQDVFIYIAGNSIQPSGSFQQAIRCRNIKHYNISGRYFNKMPFTKASKMLKHALQKPSKPATTLAQHAPT